MFPLADQDEWTSISPVWNFPWQTLNFVYFSIMKLSLANESPFPPYAGVLCKWHNKCWDSLSSTLSAISEFFASFSFFLSLWICSKFQGAYVLPDPHMSSAGICCCNITCRLFSCLGQQEVIAEGSALPSSALISALTTMPHLRSPVWSSTLKLLTLDPLAHFMMIPHQASELSILS